ncbi:MAG: helix-turn-helix domain-containing protein [Puia sp.]|nr:helix-turn-helix domain-containing protein [Puia sp.]
MAERKINSTNYLNQAYLEEKCPLNELLFLLSKRWITDILFCIEEGNGRFSGIREELEHISDQVLADRLKLLEGSGFVNRELFFEVPPRVQYSLTERGRELCMQLEMLCHFAEGRNAEMESTGTEKNLAEVK